MKPFKAFLLVTILGLVLSACGDRAAPFTLQFENRFAPRPGDEDLVAGDVTVESASVFLAESQPPQVMVNFEYFLPTPCHQLRVEASGPDEQNLIHLKAYGVIEEDRPCDLVALATPTRAGLKLGSLPGGHYTILLNGNQIGEIDT